MNSAVAASAGSIDRCIVGVSLERPLASAGKSAAHPVRGASGTVWRMGAVAFAPKTMKLSILTAALQELTPRARRDQDPDLAIEEWLQFAREIGAPNIQTRSAARSMT